MRVKQFFSVTIFGFISAWFGALAVPVIILVSCNILDYATGIMAAHNRGADITSKTGINGIFKKVGQWLLVLIGYFIDVMITTGADTIGFDNPVTALISCAVAYWLVFNELISIIENISDIGTNVPAFLLTLANKLKASIEDKENNDA